MENSEANCPQNIRKNAVFGHWMGNFCPESVKFLLQNSTLLPLDVQKTGVGLGEFRRGFVQIGVFALLGSLFPTLQLLGRFRLFNLADVL